MFVVYNCVMNDHDLRLVVLAAAICALAAFAAITLLHHVQKSTGRSRLMWLAVSAVTTGCGIWATHFIAMLAYVTSAPSGYNVTLTIISLAMAIAMTGTGFAVSLAKRLPAALPIGGLIVGGGIALMHFTGMAAFEVGGRITWNPFYAAAAIALGEAFGAAALTVGLRGHRSRRRLAGGALLTLGICLLHFTAMAAITIVPQVWVDVPESALPPSWLAIAVALASVMIIVLALAGLALDLRERHRTELEAERLRSLADAAIEGLLVCDGEHIVTVNKSFYKLLGAATRSVVGSDLGRFIRDERARARLFAAPNVAVETEIRRDDDKSIPVELIHRPIEFSGRRHHAIAVRDLRARKQAERRIHYLAHHDDLTGLSNRNTFNEQLDQEIEKARANGDLVAVLCLDLDRFKEINDLFGHAAGDDVLQTVARCVTDLLKPGYMMARLGGDEFAVIVPGVSGPSAAGRLAETILEALSADNAGSSTAVSISTSIGIAVYPSDGTDRATLLNHADTALYRAKSEGRGTYRFFETTMGAEVRDRRLLEHDLRRAIARNEFRLVFQPQRDIKANTVVGFEALLRWRHRERGDVSPALFVPIAEESGIILSIGEWVLRAACEEAARWTAKLTVAVNVSPVQLHSVNFASVVHEILLQTGLSPHRLELEVTETALIRDFHRALTTLRQLKALGIRVAMDDFGTGYSSLSNLQAFPFDKIKIDRSFIKSVHENGQAATIVRAVLGLGRGLNLPVLAEGVETQSELEFLSRENCDEVQGFLFGRPDDIAAFADITGVAGVAPAPCAPSAAA